MDVSKMTRMKAERAVAATTDPEVLKKLGDHKNKHVRQKAAFKYARMMNQEQLPSEVEAEA